MAWINHILKKGNKDSHQNTIVSNDIIGLFPKPNEKILSLIQKIPLTSQILFLYKQEKDIRRMEIVGMGDDGERI